MSDILVPIQVIIKLFTMTNELLGYWVQGNALTDPGGDTLIQSIAVVIERGMYIISQLLGLV